MSESNGYRPRLDAKAVLINIMGNKSLSIPERIVAIKILSSRNEYIATCCPGQRSIASSAGVSQQAVCKILNRLSAKGIIYMVRGQQWEKYGHGTNQYFFLADMHLLQDLIGVPENIAEMITQLSKNGDNQNRV